MSKKKSTRVGALNIKEAELDVKESSSLVAALDEKIIDLNPEGIKKLSDWLNVRLLDAQNSAEWTDAKDRIRRMREYYEKGVPRTWTGMDGAHDYRTYIAASQADGMTSRLLNVVSVDPLIKIEGRNEIGRRNARSAEILLDHHHDINVELADYKGYQLTSYITIEGHAVIYAPWVLEVDKECPQLIEKQLYTDGGENSRYVEINSSMEVSQAKADGLVPKDPPEYTVSEVKRPQIIKNFPDPQIHSLLDYLNPKYSKPGIRPDWEAIRMQFSLDQLQDLEDKGQIYPGSVKVLKLWMLKKSKDAKPVSTESTTDQVTQGSTAPFEKDALDAVVDIWVVWGKQHIESKYKRLVQAATLYHMDSNLVIQTRLNPYFGTPSPFFHPTLIRVPWRFAGIGTMELATPGEKAINDLANFVLDEGRIMSCLPYLYNKKRFPGGLSPFEFWKGVGVLDVGKDFKELNFRDRRPMDLNVASFVRGNMERRTGQGDLQLGRESDLTGKQPPTARGIISILREGQVRFTMLNHSFISEMVRLGQYEITLFQQLMGDNTPMEILGEDGKDLFPAGMSRRQIIGAYKFTANMMAQNMVRELDAELNMMLYDKLQENFFIKSSRSAFYDMTKDLLISFGKRNLWIKPLSFYERMAGQPQETQNMTPDEQSFATELINSGVPMDEVKKKLEELRNSHQSAPPPNPDASNAEASLLGGQ